MATVTNESPGLQVLVIAVRVTVLVSKTTGVTDVSAEFNHLTPREKGEEVMKSKKKSDQECEREEVNSKETVTCQDNCGHLEHL